jgi:hypothetical protein
MAKTVCSVGVVKSLSYFLFDKGDEIIATVNTPEEKIVMHHTKMELAKSWLDKRLTEMLRTNYEVE